jgi:hypothetical protein
MEIHIYDLEELIEKLEDIRTGAGNSLNFPNALLCLAKEIKKLKPASSEESQSAS